MKALRQVYRVRFLDQLFHPLVEEVQRLECLDVHRDHQVAATAALVELVRAVDRAGEAAAREHAGNHSHHHHHHHDRVSLGLCHRQNQAIATVAGLLMHSSDVPIRIHA